MFLQRVSDAARSLGKRVVEIVLPMARRSKTAESLDTIYATMLAAKCDRKTTILALGGGVIGDVAGYAAATYQRHTVRATADHAAGTGRFLGRR